MSKLPTNEYQKTYADKLVDLFLEERSNYEQKSIKLSDRASHNMYKTIQQVKTHQNKAFLIDIASAVNTLNVNDVKTAREDDREFYDIITPMIETAVVNVDIDTGHLDPYIDKPGFQAHQYAAKSLLQKFMMDTNHGVKMNEEIEQFMDDGNLIARQIDDKGEIYRLVLPQNIILGDPSAKSLEDTSVQERDTINQTELRAMKGWDNIQKVIDQCNAGSATIPFYEVFFRYGELSKEVLGNVKREVHGSDYQRQDDDDKTFIQTLTVMVRAVSGSSRAADEQAENTKAIEGIIVFAEELKPKTIQITKRLKVTRYKPYETARLGKYSGRFWCPGYREIGIPYQNRANELGNQIRQAMKILSKVLFWSSDEQIAGKNILSAVKNGQIIKAKDLQILNNVFPNLSLYAAEWNRNIEECQKALKAFEVATGETIEASASATAVAIQNERVGLYYNYKREKYSLWKTAVFRRWVIPELLKSTDMEELIKLVGDPSFIEEVVDAYLNGWAVTQYMKFIALSGGIVTPEQLDMVKQMKKEQLMKRTDLFIEAIKDFFKDVEVFVTIAPTSEMFNKRGKIANGLKLMEYRANPAIMQDPDNRDRLAEIEQLLGFRPGKYRKPPEMAPARLPNANNMPQVEPSASKQALDNAQNQ